MLLPEYLLFEIFAVFQLAYMVYHSSVFVIYITSIYNNLKLIYNVTAHLFIKATNLMIETKM
jgi:hypothetical protein